MIWQPVMTQAQNLTKSNQYIDMKKNTTKTAAEIQIRAQIKGNYARNSHFYTETDNDTDLWIGERFRLLNAKELAAAQKADPNFDIDGFAKDAATWSKRKAIRGLAKTAKSLAEAGITPDEVVALMAAE